MTKKMSELEGIENDLKADYLKFYVTPPIICSCFDENGDYNYISRRFRYFYERRTRGDKSVDIMNDMGLRKMCCRVEFLNFPLQPMIDRSKNRVFDDVHKYVITEDTRPLKFGVPPPEFPIL